MGGFVCIDFEREHQMCWWGRLIVLSTCRDLRWVDSLRAVAEYYPEIKQRLFNFFPQTVIFTVFTRIPIELNFFINLIRVILL